MAQYGYGFSNIGTLILISYALICLFRRNVFLIHKPLLVFVLLISIIQITNMIIKGQLSATYFNLFLMPIISIFIIGASIGEINFQKLYRVYSIVGTIAMLIIYYQWVRLFLFDILPDPIKILPESTGAYYSWAQAEYRPSSLFSEPQAYASYILPLLIMSLHKKSYIFSLAILLSIIFSGSTAGIVLSGIVFTYYLFRINEQWIVKISFVVVFSILAYLSLNTNVFSSQQSKIRSIDYATDIRLAKGFQIFGTFNLEEMLFGIGNGPNGLIEYNLRHESELTSMNIFDLGDYVTSVSGVLIYYGIFAGFFYFWFFYKLFQQEDPKMRILLLVIIISSFGQTLLFNGFFLLFYITYFGICDKVSFNKNYLSVRF